MQPSPAWTGVDHYENFPVASRLVPRDIRPAVIAIYHFARFADDIADEGTDTPSARLEALDALRRGLRAGPHSAEPPPACVNALWPHLERHQLSIEPLLALLCAFEQDVRGFDYWSRQDVLDYCKNSANPIGRLLLDLFKVGPTPDILAQSDAICSALQIINFLQDLKIDVGRGRFYLPRAELARSGLGHAELGAMVLSGRAQPALCDLIGQLAAWARALLVQGAPLVSAVPWRLSLELRAILAGGFRILELLGRNDFDPIRVRPKLRWTDAPALIRLFAGVGQ